MLILPRFTTDEITENELEYLKVLDNDDYVINDFILDENYPLAFDAFNLLLRKCGKLYVYPSSCGNLKLFGNYIDKIEYIDEALSFNGKKFYLNEPLAEYSLITEKKYANCISNNKLCLRCVAGNGFGLTGIFYDIGSIKHRSLNDINNTAACLNDKFEYVFENGYSVRFVKCFADEINDTYTDSYGNALSKKELMSLSVDPKVKLFVYTVDNDEDMINEVDDELESKSLDVYDFIKGKLSSDALLTFNRIKNELSDR